MHFLIGTDEAGYGPNIGPLVVSASVWRLPCRPGEWNLYDQLEAVIDPLPGGAPNGKMVICDSKHLFRSGKGLGNLERALWPCLELLDQHPRCWSELWQALAPDSTGPLGEIPWYRSYDAPAPTVATAGELETLTAALREHLQRQSIALVDLVSTAIFPQQFNRLVEQFGSKGAALTHVTLGLVARVVSILDDAPVAIICDKHGGRNNYRPHLAEHFPDWLIEVCGEGRDLSVYRFGPAARRMEARFQVKAERHLPVALASLASKYLREMAMRAVNDFWCDRVEGLRPTAGYPQDARRFRGQIEPTRVELGIAEEVFWRCR